MDHALLECYLGFWLITYCNGVFAYCTKSGLVQYAKTPCQWCPPKNIWSWCSCVRIVLGQVRCNQPKTQFGWFSAKTKMDIVFLLIVPVQFWHNKRNMSYLRELEILHCCCFLHMHWRKWKAFADYFLLLEDFPDQLSYLRYLWSIEHGGYFTDFLDVN